MINDGIRIDGDNTGGEFEIENIPVRTIEARSKDLVPVFDYVVNSKSRLAR